MRTNDEMLNALHNLIEQIGETQNTSMGVWLPYWEARAILRKLCMNKYKYICENYEVENLSFPSEGFKDIANDTNSNVEDMTDHLSL